MKIKTFYIISLTIILILLLNPVLAGSSQSYVVNFNQNQVTMQIELTLKLNDIQEFNVSITAENSSMTVIIKNFPNSGPLWGFFLEKASVYYPLNRSLAGLAACCTKYADHSNDYTVIHILSDPSPNYVLAFYDTHGHQADDTHFTATFLKGLLGVETTVYAGPNKAQSLVLFIILPIGSIAIISTFLIMVLKRRKRYKLKKEQINKPIESNLSKD